MRELQQVPTREGYRQVRAAVSTQIISGGGKAVEFKLSSASGSDFVRCLPVAGGADVYIAKPWFLRGSNTWNNRTRNGVSYSYPYPTTTQQFREATTSIGGNVVTQGQYIVPLYYPNDRIFAIRCATGLTDPQGNPIGWLDLNVDGRMWEVVI